MKDTSFHGENFRRRSRYIAVFSGLVIAFAVTVVLNINTGNVHISVPKILRILFLRDGAATEYSIIWRIRLPRILMAAMLGGALSLSGFLLQTFFANPIAGPFVLGISSGAKMVVAMTMIILGMPVANGAVLFAKRYQQNEFLAAKTVFLSTLLSIITIPVVALCFI